MKQTFYLIGLLAFIFILWDYTILYPLKILVVFFHESSHALATIFTGGQVKEMVIVKEQGGHVLSYGGNRFVVLNSGYLGSLFWGTFIYLVATFTRVDKLAMMALGILVGIITLLFVSNLFAIIFGIIVGVVLILSGRYLSENINDFILRLIGLTSMIYVPIDIFSDTIYRSHLRSDARMLAEEFGGATVIWGGIWIVISILIILICLRWSIMRSRAKGEVKETELQHLKDNSGLNL